jgi:hypothetical protein
VDEKLALLRERIDKNVAKLTLKPLPSGYGRREFDRCHVVAGFANRSYLDNGRVTVPLKVLLTASSPIVPNYESICMCVIRLKSISLRYFAKFA